MDRSKFKVNLLGIYPWIIPGFYLCYLLSLTSRPISGQHAFRQAHTAFPVRVWLENGFNLLKPEVPIKGLHSPWPFEFPAFQTVAYFVHRLLSLLGFSHISVDRCMRLSGLLFFTLNVVLLMKFAAKIFAIPQFFVNITVVIALINPYIFLWGTTGLIDWMAVFLGSLSVYLIYYPPRFFPSTHRSIISTILSLLSLSLGLMVKGPSTFAGFVFYLFLQCAFEKKISKKLLLKFTTLLTLSLVPFEIWQKYVLSFTPPGDPKRYIHISKENLGWYFGSIKQYAHPYDYLHFILSRLEPVTVPSWLVILNLIVALIYWKKNKFFSLATILTILTILLYLYFFINLNTVHDYYQIAIVLPLLFVSICLPILCLIETQNLLRNRMMIFLLIAFVSIASVMEIEKNHNPEISMYMSMIHSKSSGFDVSSVDKASLPTDGVITLGWPDDPSPLYAAKREGFAIGHSYDFAWIDAHSKEFKYLWVKPGDETDPGVEELMKTYRLQIVAFDVYKLEAKLKSN
jgi:hypothetical protein